MMFKRLLLVLCLIGFAGCEKREDKYIRLQREVADKQQELSPLIETINSLGKEPNIDTCLSKREFALVPGSKLTEQIKDWGVVNSKHVSVTLTGSQYFKIPRRMLDVLSTPIQCYFVCNFGVPCGLQPTTGTLGQIR